MTKFDIDTVVVEADRLKQELESQSPTEKTREWFAINNLNEFIIQVRNSKTENDLKNAASILSRFAVDSLEWGSDLMRRIEAISDNARQCATRVV